MDHLRLFAFQLHNLRTTEKILIISLPIVLLFILILLKYIFNLNMHLAIVNFLFPHCSWIISIFMLLYHPPLNLSIEFTSMTYFILACDYLEDRVNTRFTIIALGMIRNLVSINSIYFSLTTFFFIRFINMSYPCSIFKFYH